MKVLIVDDDKRRSSALCVHLQEVLKISPEDIVTVDSSGGARELLRARYFDALVLDIVIPRRSGERALPQVGMDLLKHITSSPTMHKPERVIGITGYLEDVSSFRQEFEQYCLTVIEAARGSAEWMNKISGALMYMATSRFARSLREHNLHALTVHGIRTFGSWQDRLKEVVQQRLPEIGFHNYKYGYFSALAFLVPRLRNREVERLSRHLHFLFEQNPGAEFIIFCHSFGTYMVAYALKDLISKGHKVPVRTLCLTGSVLPSLFDWGYLLRSSEARIVNDCADRDYVLWLSEGIVLDTGMAGKAGFYGLQNNKMINRFHQGGHSSYFSGDGFFIDYWLPLFNSDFELKPVDNRSPSVVVHEFIENIVSLLGSVKDYLYLLFLLLIVMLVFL